MKNIFIFIFTLTSIHAFAASSVFAPTPEPRVTPVATPPMIERTFPPVSALDITQIEGCVHTTHGDDTPPCPISARIHFFASTIGICDSFSAEVAQVEENATIELTIVKSTLIHCTRPEHPPQVEERIVFANYNLLKGNVKLTNSILVDQEFIKKQK